MSITPNLKLHLTLDESSGNRVDSFSGKVFTQNGTVPSVAGKLGNAASFDAVAGNYLSIASESDLEIGATQYTFLFWINPTAGGPSVQNLYVKWSGVVNEIMIRLNSTKFVDMFFSDGATKSVRSLTALTAGVWSFVACRYDGVNMSIRINGNAWANFAHTAGTVLGSQTLTIGARPANSSEGFLGALDEITYIKEALTDGEINFIYANGNGRAYPFTVPATNSKLIKITPKLNYISLIK